MSKDSLLDLAGFNPSGASRNVVQPNHAVICPESQHATPITGWVGARGAVQTSVAMGSRFTQLQVVLDPGGSIEGARPWVERFVWVLEGEVRVDAGDVELPLRSTDYFYAPPEQPHKITAASSARLLLFEHNYYSLTGVEPPTPQFGRSHNAQTKPLRGDQDVMIQLLLPSTAAFDMAVNLLSFYPGSSLPTVTSDGTERGFFMLEGQGVFRLGDNWYPVKAGDTVWAKGHCPYWFSATGKSLTRFIQYEDTNREPVES